jgi:tRNA(Ile)-lysidine synthase
MTVSQAISRVMAAYCSPAAMSGKAPDTPLLLGLSGGADSRLLLHLLAKECKESGARLHLCHVHHGIRGEEADRDEQFCRDLATEYGLPLYVAHVDVPTLARERGESVEAVAREERYHYFSSLMEEHNIPLLVTAHNADDNLETMLLHLARGCGLSGLGGIAFVRPFERLPDTLLVRPLLACSKADILAACEELGLPFVTDSTNQDTAYARNLLRAQVLPALATVHAHPEQQALRTAASLREDEQLLATLAADLLDRALCGGALDRATIAAAHPALAKRALRTWAQKESGESIETCHIEALLSLCDAHATSKEIHLPGGVVHAERSCLRWSATSKVQPIAPDFHLPLTQGQCEYQGDGFRVTVNPLVGDQHQIITQNNKNVYKPFIRDILTFDTIIECHAWLEQNRLFLRPRHEGDTLLLRGVNRKLRKLQNEVGIPTALRNCIPLLCLGDTVLWAPFAGTRDGAFPPVTKDTRHALSITIEMTPDKGKDELEETP